MYHQFIEPTKRYADIVIPEGVSNTVAIDLLTTKIEKILEEARKQQVIRCGGLPPFLFSLIMVHKWRFLGIFFGIIIP